ncbi:MAG: hypothetical protein H6978_16520 [Gammaproteobacteria bacterium]|nr:hypothetical protein [Gammaproteobacteria bacterium]
MAGWRARCADGEELWRASTHAGIVAAPMSYELDGKQYIAQLAGYGVPGYGNPTVPGCWSIHWAVLPLCRRARKFHRAL